MLTFEECKEVVEKVWGLDYPSDYYAWAHSSNTERDTAMTLYVNSWEGFGRTVEAMEQRGWSFTIQQITKGEQIGFPDQTEPESSCFFWLGMPGFSSKANNIIDATHRAALEAVKQNE